MVLHRIDGFQSTLFNQMAFLLNSLIFVPVFIVQLSRQSLALWEVSAGMCLLSPLIQRDVLRGGGRHKMGRK